MHIHFVIDSVYTKRFIEINKKIDDNSIYILLSSTTKFLESENITVIPILDSNISVIDKLKYFLLIRKYILKSERIYFHFLQDIDLFVLFTLINKSKKTYWLIWGADLYNRINYDVYDEFTKEQVCKVDKKRTLGRVIKRKIFKTIEKKAINKITYIGTIIDGDYKLLCSSFGEKNQRINFFYTNPLDFNLKLDDFINHEKINVLIGNSGDPTNNHISVLNGLKNVSNIKIYCPLSYGNAQYINEVIEHGKKLFGDDFVPVTEFMNEEKYLQFLNSIDVAIMNHYRQQALGNIFALLILGKTVYLSSCSPVYDFLLKRGVVIYDTKLILNSKSVRFNYIENEEKLVNKRIVMGLNSEEASQEFIRTLYC